MATITAFTAARSQAIEDTAITGGSISGDNLILTRHNGTSFTAGNVRGPAGPADVNSVKITGNQTVDGVKIFAKGIPIQNTSPTSSIGISKEVSSMGVGSIAINRASPSAGAESIAFNIGTTYNYIIGRPANTDDLLFGTDAGSGFTEKIRFKTDGTVISVGPADVKALNSDNWGFITRNHVGTQIFGVYEDSAYHGNIQVRNSANTATFTVDGTGQITSRGTVNSFGGGSMGTADLAALQIGHYDANYAQIMAGNGFRTNVGLLIASKGGGTIALRINNDAGKQITFDNTGTFAIQNSAADVAGYGYIFRVQSNGILDFSQGPAVMVDGDGSPYSAPPVLLKVVVAGIAYKIPMYYA